MIEKIASSILTKYLGRYVEGLEEKNLQISLMKGSVQLTNLKLRREALDGLELPITVTQGYLGELELVIPWKNLKFEQAKLHIKKLYLEAGPKEEKEETSGEEKMQATKRKILQLADLLLADSTASDASNENNNNQQQQSYFDMVTTNVVNNLQVFIDDVHIRYVHKELGLDFGIRFKSLHAQSTDENWQSKVITQNDAKDKIFFKLVQLTEFSIYWNTAAYNKEKKEGKYQYILTPVNIDVNLTINKTLTIEHPKLRISCTLPFIQINFHENQYKEILTIAESFSNYRKSIKYLHVRPSNLLLRKRTMGLWKYVIQAALYDVKRKREQCSWKFILQLLKHKKRYVSLFAKKKLLESEKLTLDPVEQQILDHIELKYEVELLIHFRSLANILYSELKDQRKKVKDEELSKKTWIGKKMFSTTAIPIIESTLSHQTIADLEIKLKMKNNIESLIMPKTYIKQRLEFVLQSAEIVIKDSSLSRLISFNCVDLSVNCAVRQEGLTLDITVQSFFICDHYTQNSLFPQILFSKSNENLDHSEPIFHTFVDLQPIGKEEDFDLQMTISSVNVVISRKLMLRIYQFFAKPLLDRKTRSLELMAIEKLQEIKVQASKQLKDFINTNKKFSISFKIPKPKILIPLNVELKSSPLLILDLGFITFEKNDAVISEDHLYTPYILSIAKANAFLSTVNYFCHDNDANEVIDNSSIVQSTLIKDFDLESNIEMCKIHDPEYPLFRISSQLDKFVATISDTSATNILLILDGLVESSTKIDVPTIKLEEIAVLSEVSKIHTKQFEAYFTIKTLELQIWEDQQNKKLLTIQFFNLQSSLIKSNQHIKFESMLSMANVADQFSEIGKGFLFTSSIEESGASREMVKTLVDLKGEDNYLISILYEGFSENSSLQHEYRHFIKLEFNSVHFFARLVTLENVALFLDNILSDFLEKKSEVSSPTPKPLNSSTPGRIEEDDNVQNEIKPVTLANYFDGKTVLLYLQVVSHSVGFSVPSVNNESSAEIEGFFGRSDLSLFVYSTGDIKSIGKIGKVTIDYEAAKHLGFPHVVEIEGDKLFQFEIFKSGPKQQLLHDNIPVNYYIKFNIDSVKYYYFHSSILFLNQYFSSLKKKQYSYKPNAPNPVPFPVSKPSPLIIYEVNIQNPCIVLPGVCDNFVEGFSLNLGCIELKNHLTYVTEDDEEILKETILIDIKKFFLESYHYPQIETALIPTILENTDIVIDITKNFHSSPNETWKVNFSIPTFSANITRYHISSLRYMISENFLSFMKVKELNKVVEDFLSISESGNIIVLEERTKDSPESLQSPQLNIDNANTLQENTEKPKKPEKTFVIKGEIVHSSIKIYNGDGINANAIFSAKSRDEVDITTETFSAPLLHLLATNCTIAAYLPPNLTQIDLTSRHFIIKDIRTNASHFEKICVPMFGGDDEIIQSSLDDMNLITNQFELKFVSHKHEKATVDISINNKFIVVMDAWIDITVFAMLVNPEIKTILKQITTVLTKESQEDVPTPLYINVTMPSTDLSLIHDPNDNSSTAFLLKSSITVNWVMNPILKSENIRITLKNTEVNITTMNSLIKMRHLLEPNDFEVSLLQENGTYYHISVESKIHLQFTFRDFFLLQKLLNNWKPTFDYFDKIRLALKDVDLMQPSVLSQCFELKTNGANLILINDMDLLEYERPLLDIDLNNFDVILANWSNYTNREKMELRTKFGLKIDYLNYSLEQWEPMLEQTSLIFELSPSPNADRNFVAEIQNINVNISKALIDAVLNTAQSYSAYSNPPNQEVIPKLRKDESIPMIEELPLDNNDNLFSSLSQIPIYMGERKIYPYYIYNCTDINIMYGLTSSTSKPSFSLTKLPANAEIPLITTRNTEYKLVGFFNDDAETLQRPASITDFVKIDSIGIYKTKLYSTNSFFTTTCEITSRKGSKLIKLRSNRVFLNTTTESFSLQILSTKNIEVTLEPNQPYYVPVSLLTPNAKFSITTKAGTHKFTVPCSFIQPKPLYNLEIAPLSNLYNTIYFLMKYSRKDCDHIFEIQPSFIVENALPISIEVTMQDAVKSPPIKALYIVDPSSSVCISDIHTFRERNIAFVFGTALGRTVTPLIIPISTTQRASNQVIQLNFKGGPPLPLRISYTTVQNVRKLVIYSDYWLINKTNSELYYQIFGGASDFLPGQVIMNTLNASNLLLYTPNNGKFNFFQSSKLSLKSLSSNWSEGFAISREGVNTAVSVIEKNNSVNEFIVIVKSGKDSNWRTKEVYIYPKYILLNQTSEVLQYSQYVSGTIAKLAPQTSVEFHWHNSKLEKLLCFKFLDEHNWSSPFAIKLNKFSAKLRYKDSTYSDRYSVNITLDKRGVTIIAISNETSPEYIINNQTRFTFLHSQKLSIFAEQVEPNETKPFALDDIEKNHILELTMENMKEKLEIPLNKFSFYDTPFTVQNEELFWNFSLTNEGISKILTLKTTTQSQERPQAMISLLIKNIYISFIDEKPQEIALLNLDSINIVSCIVEDDININVSLKFFQFDSQLPTTYYPVLVRPLNLVKDDKFLNIITSVRKESKSVLFFKKFQMSLKPIDVHLDEEIIVRLMGFSKAITSYLEDREVVDDEMKIILNAVQPKSVFATLYFDSFKILPLELCASFAVNPASVDDEFNRLLPPHLRLLANFENTSFTFDMLYTEAVKCAPSELSSKILSYYSISLQSKLFYLLSSDIIGDPKTLFSNISTGFYDFFNEPTDAIANSPSNIGTGFAKGTKSLVYNSIYALSNTTSKLTNTLASGIASASFDADFQRQRDWNKARERPQDLVDGTAMGLKSIGKGFFDGFTGMFSEPVKGYQEGSGVFMGLVKGTTGLLLKPTVGVLDSFTKFSEGIKNSTSLEEAPKRVRLPRYIGRDKVVKTYDWQDAFNQYLLHSVLDRKYSHLTPLLVFDVSDGSEKFIATSEFLILIKNHAVVWELDIFRVTMVLLYQSSSIMIYYRNKFNEESQIPLRPFFSDSQNRNSNFECEELRNQLHSIISFAHFNST